MKSIHHEISLRLGKLDFNNIYPGLHPFRFALYNDERVCFGDTEIPRDDRFTGNTAIQFEGQWTAIWKLSGPPADLDRLTAKIVHEMFHAYQGEAGFPQSRDEVVGAFYPRERRNFELKYREDLLLAELTERFVLSKWNEFIALRARRFGLYPEAAENDLYWEEQEGLAVYAEWQALKDLNPELYRKALAGAVSNISSPEKVFDVRLLSYTLGALIQTLLAAQGLDRPALKQQSHAGETPAAAAIPDLGKEFEEYFSKIDKAIREVLEKGEKLDLAGKNLQLFDPYNLRASGEYLYHPHFIGVETPGKGTEFLSGIYVTKMAGRTRAIEEAWRAAQG